MRLIDADKFKEQIAAMAVKNNYDVHVVNKLCEIIDVQPTAIIVPEKMEVCGTYGKGDIPASYKIGWNACIDKILKDGGANVNTANKEEMACNVAVETLQEG